MAGGDPERRVAWWLEEGEDQCPHCLVFYRAEVGFWCVDCDGPVCPACLARVRVRAEVVCPVCADDPVREVV